MWKFPRIHVPCHGILHQLVFTFQTIVMFALILWHLPMLFWSVGGWLRYGGKPLFLTYPLSQHFPLMPSSRLFGRVLLEVSGRPRVSWYATFLTIFGWPEISTISKAWFRFPDWPSWKPPSRISSLFRWLSRRDLWQRKPMASLVQALHFHSWLLSFGTHYLLHPQDQLDGSMQNRDTYSRAKFVIRSHNGTFTTVDGIRVFDSMVLMMKLQPHGRDCHVPWKPWGLPASFSRDTPWLSLCGYQCQHPGRLVPILRTVGGWRITFMPLN